MASEMIIGYTSNRSESVEIDDTCSSRCSAIGRIESSMLCLSFHSSLELWAADSASNYC
jgi:hypothetical protein